MKLVTIDVLLNLKIAFSETKELKDHIEAERPYRQEEIKLEHNYENIVGQSDEINYVLYKAEKLLPPIRPFWFSAKLETVDHPYRITDAQNEVKYDHWSYLTIYAVPILSANSHLYSINIA